MNSMAQQAVPKGKGQNELRCAQSSRVSNVVVTQLSPSILFMCGSLLSRGAESITSCDRQSQAVQVARKMRVAGSPQVQRAVCGRHSPGPGICPAVPPFFAMVQSLLSWCLQPFPCLEQFEKRS